MADEDDIRDAALFRLWIRLCEQSPIRVAKGLAHCIRPAEYRDALIKLAHEEGLNLPAGRIASAAKSVCDHWAEFGPEHGFDETMESLYRAML